MAAEYVEIAAATMNLYPLAVGHRASWGSGLHEMVGYLAATGYHDFEVHATNRMVGEIRAQADGADRSMLDVCVGSQHQTFNSGVGIIGRIMDARGVIRDEQSVYGMRTIHRALGRERPAIYYAEGLPKSFEFTDEDPQLRAEQPHAELYRYLHGKFADLDVYSNGGFFEALERIGIPYSCNDTIHSRRRAADGSAVPAVEEVWEAQFASGRVIEMHAASNRVDMKSRDAELAALSVAEDQAFLKGLASARRTQLGQMIISAVRAWQPPTVLGHSTLRIVTERPPVPAGYPRQLRNDARYVETLAGLVQEAGATPRLWAR